MSEFRRSRRHEFTVVMLLMVAATTLLQYRTQMKAEPNKTGKRSVASSSFRLHYHPPNRSSFGERSDYEDPRTLDETTNESISATTVATSLTEDFRNQTSRDNVNDGRSAGSEIYILKTDVAQTDERGPTSNDIANNESERSPALHDIAANNKSRTSIQGSSKIIDFELSNQTSRDDVHDYSNSRAVLPDRNTSNSVAREEERNPATESISANESSTPTQSSSSSSSSSSINISDLFLYSANKSSVDYYACCGAGHRLIRTANAYHLAREINFGLRVFWGWCDKIEVYHHLFGPEPIQDLTNVTSLNQRIEASNEVGGFDEYHGTGPDGMCLCTEAKIQNDINFYSSLRDRFSQRHQVDDFVRQHFDNAPLVLGMHIRTGNNETGDFTSSGRAINNITQWLYHVVEHVKTLLHHRRPDLYVSKERDVNPSQHPPVLFVASDTPSMVPKLQSMFSTKSLQVLAFPHIIAAKEGTGVSFGEHGAPTPEGRECVLAWESIFIEMMILSHMDLLVSPRYSSFGQSIPLSLVYAQWQNRTMTMTTTATRTTATRTTATRTTATRTTATPNTTLPPAACFLDYDAVSMKCYHTFLDWCCDDQSLQSIVLMFPDKDQFSNRTWMQMEPRSPQCDLVSPHDLGCLPFPVERAPEVDKETRNISSSRKLGVIGGL